MKPTNSEFSRIVIISNRLPVTIKKIKGKLTIQQSPGGLATGLRHLQSQKKVIFIGWPGYIPENQKEQNYIEKNLKSQYHCYPIFLTRHEFEKYYYGFSNRTLWPLFHYFTSHCTFEETEWEVYKQVNQKFYQKIKNLVTTEDIFWIHDYHLLLLPQLIRKKYPASTIGFFLHIPFPSSEIFRILPWRTELLEGVLGSDLVGFHTYEYARHFLSSSLRLLGYEQEFASISVKDRIVKVDNYPIGINAKEIEDMLQQPETQKDVDKLKKSMGVDGKTIILSVDRLDYSKGIPQRLEAYELFLSQNPTCHNKITYLMICTPSRTKVKDYSLLKQEVDGLIGKINGRFGNPGWTPIHYLYQFFPFEKLLPFYVIADIAFITPIRDGMNLVAKEYIASKTDNRGALILSETAGAVEELSEALIINVNNKKEIVRALCEAINMTEEEQIERMKPLRQRIVEYDINHWTQSFIQNLIETKKKKTKHIYRKFNLDMQRKLFIDFKRSKQRLFLFDYDGTLISFYPRPDRAVPDSKLKKILLSFANNPKNMLVIISGRDQKTMERWLGDIPCALVAEHGASVRNDKKSKWRNPEIITLKWKEEVRPILKSYEARVPGSFVEEKEIGLAWHYRNAIPELGEMRACQLHDYLKDFLANIDLQVLHGKKVVEVKPLAINKGKAAFDFLNMKKWDFILALGDDLTDEDMFKMLPPFAYSIKIGFGTTHAKLYIESPQECRALLSRMSKT